MLDIFLDALIDSLKVFGIAFVLYFLFSFVHERVTASFQKHKGVSPLLGASCGLIPECGISVVGADMYHKKQISMGTILAIFFACSDEALFILCSDYKKIAYMIPLLAIKWICGMGIGYLVDAIFKRRETIESALLKVDCCEHHHNQEGFLLKHLLHPFLHCLKIFMYVLIVNLFFGILVHWIGEEQIISFLSSNEALAPLFAGLIGLIPNCAASVLMSELFLLNGLSFGALVTGLSVNAGVGLIYLLKFKETRKNALWMLLILFLYSLCIGYILFAIMKGV
ncbi:MAG: arsenic efflux protein [Anaeroplasmataceae bacterium]|nr:arsenic efflux protein [Anaeroplasmataceae bacterium]